MAEQSRTWDTFKAEGESALGRIRALIREGNVRRVVVEHDGHVVAEFPLTAGVVGAVFSPILAAVGAFIAILQDCTIRVEKESGASEPAAQRSAAGGGL